nr:MAG TPA: hypothetical protein [Caudoviricetes sp.]
MKNKIITESNLMSSEVFFFRGTNVAKRQSLIGGQGSSYLFEHLF